MKKNKILSLMLVLSMLVAGGLLFSQKALAQESESKYPLVVQKLIEKFNLNTDEVDQVMEEVHAEREEMWKQNMEEKLNQAVTDGKITEEQKTLILAKFEEWHNQKEDWRDLTEEERKQKMITHRDEMKAWAEENNIDLNIIFGFHHKGFVRGFKRGFKAGQE